MSDCNKLKNSHSLDETVDLLRYYIAAIKCPDALALLEKAISKAQTEKEYAMQLKEVLLHGSTVQYRELFSPFGDYWAMYSKTDPLYTYMASVDLIDSAMLHIKCGDVAEAIEYFNLVHNRF